MSIILAVNPPYAGQLVDGTKRVEWRKGPLPNGLAYIYETKRNGGCGAVIGRVTIVGNAKIKSGQSIPISLVAWGRVEEDALTIYANGGDIYANAARYPARYKEPKPITAFSRYGDGEPFARAPQSWAYGEENKA